jgi:hypothetical protein
MFAFGIRSEAADDVRAWLSAGLGDHGYRLDDDGWIATIGTSPGGGYATGLRWAIVPAAELAARPWHAATHPCPFLAPLTAYVTVEPVWEDLLEHPELRLGLVRLCRGVVARLDTDVAHQAVALRAYDLASSVRKSGFDDGDVLLTRAGGSAYAADVLARIDRAAASAGRTVDVSWTSTCHNPGRDDVHGAPTDPRTLAGIEVEIWAYDFDALFDDDAFWTR